MGSVFPLPALLSLLLWRAKEALEPLALGLNELDADRPSPRIVCPDPFARISKREEGQRVGQVLLLELSAAAAHWLTGALDRRRYSLDRLSTAHS